MCIGDGGGRVRFMLYYWIKWNFFTSKRIPFLRTDIVRTDLVRLNEVQIAETLLIFDTEQCTQPMSHMSWISYRVFLFYFFLHQKYYSNIYSFIFLSALARRYGISINPFSHRKLIYSVSRRVFFFLWARGVGLSWGGFGGRESCLILKWNLTETKKKNEDERRRFTQPVYCLILNKITGGIVIAYANITFIACKPFQILVECCFLSFRWLPRVDLFPHLHFSTDSGTISRPFGECVSVSKFNRRTKRGDEDVASINWASTLFKCLLISWAILFCCNSRWAHTCLRSSRLSTGSQWKVCIGMSRRILLIWKMPDSTHRYDWVPVPLMCACEAERNCGASLQNIAYQ